MIKNNFKRLCLHPVYSKSYKIIDCEANDWTKADRYCKDLMADEFGVEMVFPDSADKTDKKRYGIYTDPAAKLNWKTEVENAFMSGAVCYANDFVTCGDAEHFKRAFEEETRFFRVENKIHENPWEKDKFIITGKGNGGRLDDRICAFGFLLTQRTRQLHDPRWQAWAEARGIMI